MHKTSRDEHLTDTLEGVSSTNDLMKPISTVGLTFEDCESQLKGLEMLCYVGSLYEESCSCEHVELFSD